MTVARSFTYLRPKLAHSMPRRLMWPLLMLARNPPAAWTPAKATPHQFRARNGGSIGARILASPRPCRRKPRLPQWVCYAAPNARRQPQADSGPHAPVRSQRGPAPARRPARSLRPAVPRSPRPSAFQQPEGQPGRAQQSLAGIPRKPGEAMPKPKTQSRADNLAPKNKRCSTSCGQLVESAETKDSSGKSSKQLQAEWKAAGAGAADRQPVHLGHLPRPARYLLQPSRGSSYADEGPGPPPQPGGQRGPHQARAEALHDAPGINKALDELTKLHEDWKNIGPVPNDQREPLWQRFHCRFRCRCTSAARSSWTSARR